MRGEAGPDFSELRNPEWVRAPDDCALAIAAEMWVKVTRIFSSFDKAFLPGVSRPRLFFPCANGFDQVS